MSASKDSEINSSLIKNQYPLLFRGLVKQWSCAAWTLDDWRRKCHDIKFDFRIDKRDSDDIQWENEPEAVVEATLDQFNDWINDTCTTSNPFSKFLKNDYWAYSSYNYMHEKFNIQEHGEILNAIDWWSLFGRDHKRPKVDFSDSTLWIGTLAVNGRNRVITSKFTILFWFTVRYERCSYTLSPGHLWLQLGGPTNWLVRNLLATLFAARFSFSAISVVTCPHQQLVDRKPHVLLLQLC